MKGRVNLDNLGRQARGSPDDPFPRSHTSLQQCEPLRAHLFLTRFSHLGREGAFKRVQSSGRLIEETERARMPVAQEETDWRVKEGEKRK